MIQTEDFEGIRINNAYFKDNGDTVTVDVNWEVGYIPSRNSPYVSWSYSMTLVINGEGYGQMVYGESLPYGTQEKTKSITLPSRLKPVNSVVVNMEAYYSSQSGYFASKNAIKVNSNIPDEPDPDIPDEPNEPEEPDIPVTPTSSRSWIVVGIVALAGAGALLFMRKKTKGQNDKS
jgi:LPXTG-motif cell wall-anchored protein